MKTTQLQIRATPAEKLAWWRAASKAGLTLAEWVRSALNDRAAK